VRILVYEFASGGGLAGRDVPASLVREGAAMRAALVADLSAIGGHQVVTTADTHGIVGLPRGVDVVTLPEGDRARTNALDAAIRGVDGVWLVAPETDRCLEQLAAAVEQHGKQLLGSGADAIARASDKARLPRRLARAGVRHPATRTLAANADCGRAAGDIGYPIVVKPARGAGSCGVALARDPGELRRAVRMARGATGRGVVLLQQYIPGTAASVSLLADGRRAVALALNQQILGPSPSFAYRGGVTPFDPPLASRALAAALDTCRVMPGLRGFVGVDLIVTETDVLVIEVNPRLTTSYLGVRRAFDENVAALAVAASTGELPPPPVAKRRIRFTASGRTRIVDRDDEDAGSPSRSLVASCSRGPSAVHA
jgi:tyramine---L-glutamate ligase